MDNTSTIILAFGLIVIMLGMGLSLQMADFKRVLQYPKAIFVGLTNQLILLPLIGLGIASIFPMQPEIAIGIMILAACPGGPTSNLISHLAKGDLALSVTLTALSSLITILTIPFIVSFALEYFLAAEQTITLNILETIIQIFIIVVIPVIVGMMIRRFYPVFSLRMSKPVRIASGLLLAVIIIGIVLKERTHMVSYIKQAGLPALFLNIITMGLGYYSAKFFKLRKEAAVSIAIESGIQNGTLAVSIAVLLLNNVSFAVAPAIYSLLMFLTAGVIIYVSNKFIIS